MPRLPALATPPESPYPPEPGVGSASPRLGSYCVQLTLNVPTVPGAESTQ